MKTLQDLNVNTILIPCDFCGGDKFIHLFDKMRHDLNLNTVICENCALIMTNPQPNEETLQDFYENFYHIFHGRQKGVNDYYIDKSKRLDAERIELLKKIVDFDIKDKKVLEIGCGLGQFIKELGSSTSWDVLGLEPGKDSYEYCKSENINVEKTGIEDFETDIKFDIVASFFVLDHLRSPKTFLNKCSELLNEGGLIFIEVANFYKPSKSYTEWLQFPALYSLGPISLSNYLRSAGFEIIFMRDSKNKLSIFGIKTSIKTKNFVRTDVQVLIDNIYWVDKIHRTASRIPGWNSLLKKTKKALHKISL